MGLKSHESLLEAVAHGGNHGAYKRLGRPQATAPPQDRAASLYRPSQSPRHERRKPLQSPKGRWRIRAICFAFPPSHKCRGLSISRIFQVFLSDSIYFFWNILLYGCFLHLKFCQLGFDLISYNLTVF